MKSLISTLLLFCAFVEAKTLIEIGSEGPAQWALAKSVQLIFIDQYHVPAHYTKLTKGCISDREAVSICIERNGRMRVQNVDKESLESARSFSSNSY